MEPHELYKMEWKLAPLPWGNWQCTCGVGYSGVADDSQDVYYGWLRHKNADFFRGMDWLKDLTKTS